MSAFKVENFCPLKEFAVSENSFVVTQTLFPISDLCQRWRLSRGTLMKLIRENELASVHVGKRHMCTLDQVLAFEQKLTDTSTSVSSIAK